MEKDPEVKGDGNSYTTEFRQYDPRVGRWLSLDPLMSMFPDMSPYVAFDNNPVYFVDPYGLASTNGDEGEGEPVKTESGSECDDGKKLESDFNTPDGGSITIPSEASDYTFFNSDKIKAGDRDGNSYSQNVFNGSLSGFSYMGEQYSPMFKNGYFHSYVSSTNSAHYISASENALPINRTCTPRGGGNESLAAAGGAFMESPAALVVGMALALYYAENFQNISALFSISTPLNPTGGFEVMNSDDVQDNVENANSESMNGADVSSSTPPLDPDDFNEDDVSFGNDSNQDYHTFRHIEQEYGLNRETVKRAVLDDIKGQHQNMQVGKVFSREITVNGQRLQYNAFRVLRGPNAGKINIGRINGL